MNDIMNIQDVHGYLDKDNNVWLSAEDVARGFGLTQQKNNIEYVRWETVNSYLSSFGFSQEVGKGSWLPENMVYLLGFKASNETARSFQLKLANEVLPSIRKHGAYMTEATIQKALTSPDFLIQLATQLKEEQQLRHQLEQKVEEDKPKIIFADAIVGSRGSCLVGELAKILTKNEIVVGQNKLFKWLRGKHFLGSVGERYNIPNQKYVEQGLFELKKTVHDENGVMVSKVTTKVTGKGQQYFINGFLNGRFKINLQ